MLLAGIVLLVFLHSRTLPPDAEETGLAVGIFVLGTTIMLSELAALGPGIAGVFQRTREVTSVPEDRVQRSGIRGQLRLDVDTNGLSLARFLLSHFTQKSRER